VAGRGPGGAPSFLKTWRPSFKIRQWPEVLAAPPCPEDPAAGTQVPKIRRSTLLPQDPMTDAQGNLSLFIPWVWNNYSKARANQMSLRTRPLSRRCLLLRFSRASPTSPAPSGVFRVWAPHSRISVQPSGSWFFSPHLCPVPVFLHCMDCIVCFCVKGNIFFFIKHFIKIVSNLDMLFIQELIHLSHDHIGTLEFEYIKIASSSWPWYWKQELHNLNTTILRQTSIIIMLLNNFIWIHWFCNCQLILKARWQDMSNRNIHMNPHWMCNKIALAWQDSWRVLHTAQLSVLAKIYGCRPRWGRAVLRLLACLFISSIRHEYFHLRCSSNLHPNNSERKSM
jgi:hypothetical protein